MGMRSIAWRRRQTKGPSPASSVHNGTPKRDDGSAPRIEIAAIKLSAMDGFMKDLFAANALAARSRPQWTVAVSRGHERPPNDTASTIDIAGPRQNSRPGKRAAT